MKIIAFVLEDDPNFQKILELKLKSWNRGIEIHLTKSIAEAKTFLNQTNIDFTFAVLDQHLPDGRGLELFDHPKIQNTAILAVSSDNAADLPGSTLKAGAGHFLSKRQISEPLFIPLLEALVERKKLEKELLQTKLNQQKYDTIKLLLATLRHEINNPLGAVLGGSYLLKAKGTLDSEQQEALKLIEASGNRIKHVIQELCAAAELEEVTKGKEQIFQVPGDPKWKS